MGIDCAFDLSEEEVAKTRNFYGKAGVCHIVDELLHYNARWNVSKVLLEPLRACPEI